MNTQKIPMSKYSFVLCLIITLSVTSTALTDEPFRPESGKFPPLEKAKAYDGQLMFVDHANRRGSIRVTGGELFHSTAPHPFAMLPYGVIRYHGAPADLRDVPLGTMLHGRFYLSPDPKLSSVPVITKASLTQPATFASDMNALLAQPGQQVLSTFRIGHPVRAGRLSPRRPASQVTR